MLSLFRPFQTKSTKNRELIQGQDRKKCQQKMASRYLLEKGTFCASNEVREKKVRDSGQKMD